MNTYNDQNQNDSFKDINVENQQHNPEDTISDISFSNQNGNSFCCSSWDGTLRIYDCQQKYSYMNNMGNSKYLVQKAVYQNSEPLLCCDWGKDCQFLFAGTGDNKIICIDLQKGSILTIGQHNAPVIKIFWIKEMDLLASFSYDKTFKFWQLGNQNPTVNFLLDNRIYTADLLYPMMAMGLSDQRIAVQDIKQLQYIRKIQDNESQLGKDSQISTLSLGLEKKSGYNYSYSQDKFQITYSSTDGRTNVSNIVQTSDKLCKLESNITFKSQKQDIDKKQILYPVNAAGFNSRNSYFIFTAGGDGSIQFWDRESKNKIKTFNFNKCPVSTAKISQDGKIMVYALGYDWHCGIDGINQFKPKICMHDIPESEMKYKPN